MKLLNDLCKKEMIGGFYTNDGEVNLFNPDSPITETYYWDDTGGSKEGFKLTFNAYVNINKIIIYSTDRYPLGNVNIYVDGKLLYSQDCVSRSNPILFEGNQFAKVVEIYRYNIRDSVFSKICIYGSESSYLINKNNLIYNIKNNYYNNSIGNYEPMNISSEADKRELFINNGFSLENMNKEINLDNVIFKPIDKFEDYKLIKLGR